MRIVRGSKSKAKLQKAIGRRSIVSCWASLASAASIEVGTKATEGCNYCNCLVHRHVGIVNTTVFRAKLRLRAINATESVASIQESNVDFSFFAMISKDWYI